MKTGMKLGICALVGVALGYVLGCYAPATALNEESVRGDISKVSKYSKGVVSPSMSAFQEKILNDSIERKKTAASLAVLNNRMNEFDNLVRIAVEVSGDIDQLNESVAGIRKVSKLAENAKLASEQALEAFDAMCEGDVKQAPNQYEDASQNLVLAYLLVERQLNVAKGFVSEVDNYLKGKSIEDNADLALVRDLWAGYCTCDAVLSNDSESLAYWKDKESLVSEDLLGGIVLSNQHLSSLFAYIIANQRLIVVPIKTSEINLAFLKDNCIIAEMLEASLASHLEKLFMFNLSLIRDNMLAARQYPVLENQLISLNNSLMDQMISFIWSKPVSLIFRDK